MQPKRQSCVRSGRNRHSRFGHHGSLAKSGRQSLDIVTRREQDTRVQTNAARKAPREADRRSWQSVGREGHRSDPRLNCSSRWQNRSCIFFSRLVLFSRTFLWYIQYEAEWSLETLFKRRMVAKRKTLWSITWRFQHDYEWHGHFALLGLSSFCQRTRQTTWIDL